VSDGLSDEVWQVLEERLLELRRTGELTYFDVTPQEIRATYPITTEHGVRRWIRIRVNRAGQIEVLE
jgi:hypothetical protein